LTRLDCRVCALSGCNNAVWARVWRRAWFSPDQLLRRVFVVTISARR
jgi:hypothetical protein